MSSGQLEGTVIEINEVKLVGQKQFPIQEIIISWDNASGWPSYHKLDLKFDAVEQMKAVSIGDVCRFDYELQGRQWTNNDGVVKTFNSTSCTKVFTLAAAQAAAEGNAAETTGGSDLPF